MFFYTIWIAHTNLNMVLFRKRLQRYCFFMKKHSQIVQFDSQIVQIFLFSLQIAIFRYIKNPCHAGDRDVFKSGAKVLFFQEPVDGKAIESFEINDRFQGETKDQSFGTGLRMGIAHRCRTAHIPVLRHTNRSFLGF